MRRGGGLIDFTSVAGLAQLARIAPIIIVDTKVSKIIILAYIPDAGSSDLQEDLPKTVKIKII